MKDVIPKNKNIGGNSFGREDVIADKGFDNNIKQSICKIGGRKQRRLYRKKYMIDNGKQKSMEKRKKVKLPNNSSFKFTLIDMLRVNSQL